MRTGASIFLRALACNFWNRDRDLLHNLDPKPLQCGHMSRCVRQQADLVDPEIGQDLPPQPHLAKGPLSAILAAFAGAMLTMEDHAVRSDVTVDPEACAAIVQVDQRSASGLGNHLQ